MPALVQSVTLADDCPREGASILAAQTSVFMFGLLLASGVKLTYLQRLTRPRVLSAPSAKFLAVSWEEGGGDEVLVGP